MLMKIKMNILEALKLAQQILKPMKNLSSHLDAEVLLCFILNKEKEFLYTHPEYQLTKKQTTEYTKLLKRRAKNEPIAYLVGHKEFFGLDFIVNKNVLIPRPDTEIMIEEVLKKTSEIASLRSQNQKPHFLDVASVAKQSALLNTKINLIDIGTGSGCIPITLAHTFKQNKNINVLASDVSTAALKVAAQNAKNNKVKVTFLKGDLLTPILKNKILTQQIPLIITANLPYLTASQIKKEPSIHKEPYLALYGGKDGLVLYKKLLEQIKKLLLKQSIPFIFLEIDPSQVIKIKKLITKILPLSSTEIKKDLGNKNRLVIITL